YIMVKHQMVTSPIVLAIILGPIAEQSLLQSLTLARSTPILAYYASRPIVLVMVALSIFSILWTVMREKKISKKAKEAQSA
ncbi:MAG: C4-dicarboxylate ABC transporter permease, partial [Oscillospiraceae bacterium]